MKRELDYIYIDGAIGGNQDWLPEWDMHMGGCAAVTACDLCMYLSRCENFPDLYPFKDLSRENFIKFASIMKPYLTPRYHGIDYLEIYLCGLGDYWRKIKYEKMRLEGLSGNVSAETARNAIRAQINSGVPVPYLMLNHTQNQFEDFEWHWFNLAGYDDLDDLDNENDNNMLIKVVTYGEIHWLNFNELWNTGVKRRGGIIRVIGR